MLFVFIFLSVHSCHALNCFFCVVFELTIHATCRGSLQMSLTVTAVQQHPACFPSIALESLGFGSYQEEAKEVMKEAKAVAAKKRRKSTKLENLGIPEEELLRQQQELFAKVLYLMYYINLYPCKYPPY